MWAALRKKNRAAACYRSAALTRMDGARILVEAFEARGEIYGRTKRSIVNAIDGADIADDSLSGMEAASAFVDRPSFALELGIQAIVGALKRERGGAGVDGMIGIVRRRIPYPMNGIDDKFVEYAMPHDFFDTVAK